MVSSEIGDHDGDGIQDLMVKFDRQTLIALLRDLVEPPTDVKLTVIGELDDGTIFEGSDVIKVINKAIPRISEKIFSYPNPFTTSTTITYTITRQISLIRPVWSTNTQTLAPVTLKIYDVTGRLIRTFRGSPCQHPCSSVSVMWDGKDYLDRKVPAGVYFCQLTIGDSTFQKKIVLLE